MPFNRQKRSQQATQEMRDNQGHFIKKEHPQTLPSPGQPQPHQNKIIELLQENVHYSKKQDDLLDLHVGNPLKRITLLLEDIKRQKAFSFSIKGSLGVMGVVIVASTFGVFGAGNLLCDKGVQTRKGVVEVLNYKENTSTSILNYIPFVSNFLPQSQENRKILNEANGNILHVVTKNRVNLTMFLNRRVTLSGKYDSCSQTLTVSTPDSIQLPIK